MTSRKVWNYCGTL